MSRRPIQLIDPSRNVLAVVHVTQEWDRYEGTVDLTSMPASLRALFEEFEEIVNGQMFSFLDDIQAKIASLSIKTVLDDGREMVVKDLQVFPSTGDVSFKVKGTLEQDLEQRLAAYEANPKAGSSWEEVK